MMEKWQGRTALVTGASSGIGKAIAYKLTSLGINVFACARNLQKLNDLSQSCCEFEGKLSVYKCDLSVEDEILAMFKKIKEEYKVIDICINNAGFTMNAPLLTGQTEKWRSMIDVNIVALSICTRESIKLMKENKIDDGFIVNISSMAGHRVLPMPSSHFYMATKHMVRALTEGTQYELKAQKSGIRAFSISPGIVKTEFFERGLGAKTSENILKSIEPLQAEDIVNALLYALSQPPRVNVTDILIRSTSQ